MPCRCSKWAFALNRMSLASGEERYNKWAVQVGGTNGCAVQWMGGAMSGHYSWMVQPMGTAGGAAGVHGRA